MGIIWLASYPRSGNTWLRAILANLLAEKTPAPLADLNRLAPHEADPRWYRQFEGDADAEPGPTRANVQRRLEVQSQLSSSFTEHDAYLKTHNALMQVSGLPLVRDDLTVSAIYLARDPRDVAVSLSHTLGISIDHAIEFLGKNNNWIGGTAPLGQGPMFEMLGNWSDHVKSWAKTGSAILRYEDLFEREDAYELLNAAFYTKATGAKLREVRALCAFDKLQALEQAERAGSNEKAPLVFREGKPGAWRDQLSVGQAKRIELNHADVMRRLNYL